MKPILFVDFDGTLCHDRFWKSLEPLYKEKIQQYLFIKNKELVRDWMKGNYSSEEINKLLAEELNLKYQYLWNIFVSDCKNMVVSKFELEKIKSLSTTYYTILLTDNMDCFDRFTVPSLGLKRYFDEIISSHNLKKSKIDIISQYKEKIPKSILIDNSPNVCKTFKELGGKSFLVTETCPLDYWLDTLV